MNQGYEKFFKEAKQVRQPQEPQFKLRATSDNKDAQKSNQIKKQPNKQLRNKDPLSQIDEHFATKGSGHHLSPEQKLKIKFLERKRQLKAQSSRRGRPPYFAISCLVAIAACVTLGYYNFHKVDFILKHIEIQMSGAQAAANVASQDPSKNEKPAPANSAEPATPKAEKKSQTEADKTASNTPDLRNMTKEEVGYFSHLADRKKELDQREAELNKLDEELQKQRVELDQKIQKLEKMRTEISGILKDRVEVDQEKVGKLVQFYSSMKAQQAARVIESLNEELAVEVLDKMKKKSAAEIMNSLDPKKAKKLSEMLAGYRKPANDDDSKR